MYANLLAVSAMRPVPSERSESWQTLLDESCYAHLTILNSTAAVGLVHVAFTNTNIHSGFSTVLSAFAENDCDNDEHSWIY